jgi:hypothetical protein
MARSLQADLENIGGGPGDLAKQGPGLWPARTANADGIIPAITTGSKHDIDASQKAERLLQVSRREGWVIASHDECADGAVSERLIERGREPFAEISALLTPDGTLGIEGAELAEVVLIAGDAERDAFGTSLRRGGDRVGKRGEVELGSFVGRECGDQARLDQTGYGRFCEDDNELGVGHHPLKRFRRLVTTIRRARSKKMTAKR